MFSDTLIQRENDRFEVGFNLNYSNSTFDDLFESKNNCHYLLLKLFWEYIEEKEHHRELSLNDLLTEISKKFHT